MSLLAVLALLTPRIQAQEQAFGWARFESYLESLRLQANIPGLSVVVVKNGQIVWERGLGFQNVEAVIRAQPDTPYHVVGLTQMMSAVLAMACVDQGRLDLQTPVTRYVPAFAPPTATLRHLMTHTSDNVPGTAFRFDLARYALLTPALEGCWPRVSERPGAPASAASRKFREILTAEILDRLAMIESVPGQDVTSPAVIPTLSPQQYDAARLDRYRGVLARLARPYASGSASSPTPAAYPANTLDAARGLVTTARDLARFDIALGDLVLLQTATIEQMWTPLLPTLPIGTLPPQSPVSPLPHALGWFVQDYQGTRLVWQFGRWPGVTSSIVVKVPIQNLTFILLANSDGIAKTAALETGDITTSLFARLFLRFFL